MKKTLSDLRLKQAEVMMALSLATDLGTGRPMEWAMRSAMLGVRLGEALQLDESELREVYYGMLLIYVGCTAEVDLAIHLLGDDPAAAMASVDLIDKGDPAQMGPWLESYIGAGQPPEERAKTLANAGKLIHDFQIGHCEVARYFAERLGFDPGLREALGQMYERWDGDGLPRGLKGEALRRSIRIILLIRDLEAYLYTHGVEAAVAVARQRAGSLHDPTITARFCDLAPVLCSSLNTDATWDAVVALEPSGYYLSENEWDDALLAIADFVDLLSPWFLGHSRRVASLSRSAAALYGLPDRDRQDLWRAALIHDVGKVAIPFGYWNRPGSLNRSEWERIRLHPYYTERIFARPDTLATLAAIAGTHHERLDGSGYYRAAQGNAIVPMARILAAANFYGARIEQRPHREALSPEDAAQALRLEVRQGRLDSDAVNAVLAAAGQPTKPIRRDHVAGLSEREIEVLRLIAGGRSNRQMAAELGISEKTVGTHIMHVYEKIGCSSRSVATLFAVQHGLVPRP
jgi:HD-GYP domain-containing protein (c-di-GMP phosphodiesterase class II)